MPPENLDRLRNARILVVEDSIANQTLARDLLLHAGAHVSLAGNGHEALAAIREATRPYDAVLMDLQMPVMDGLEAIGFIRNELKQTMPIVATSAHSNKLEEERCLAIGADSCLPKPFHIDDLYDVLSNCLESVDRPKSEPVEQAADPDVWLPDSLEGIDMAEGLDRLGQNRALYLQLLVEFAKTNSGLIAELDHAEQHGDAGRIRFLVHAIRSTAGSIGAVALSKAAADVEGGVIEGDANLSDHLAGFRTEMLQVLQSISIARLDSPTNIKPVSDKVPVFDQGKAGELFEKLVELLDNQDMSAQKEFDSFASMLGGGGLDGILTEILESMLALDYDAARKILVGAEKDLLR